MTTFLLPLLLTLLLALTLLSSTTAQFGVGKKKGGAKSAFEQAQERAGTNGNVGIANRKQKGGANGGANGGATSTGDPDVDALMAELTAGMSTEELQQMEALMESMGDMDLGAAMGDMQEVFSAMADMDPDELVGMVHEAMQTPEVQEMLKDPAAMLEGIRGMGMIDDGLIDEYIANPKKHKREIKKITDEMMAVFNDPEMMKEMIGMLSGMGEMLSDPEKMEAALLEIVSEFENWDADMGSDEKLEAARLEMLNNPDLASNPMLSSVFNTDEMQDILRDPKKWRETIQEGQQQMRRGGGVGEL